MTGLVTVTAFYLIPSKSTKSTFAAWIDNFLRRRWQHGLVVFTDLATWVELLNARIHGRADIHVRFLELDQFVTAGRKDYWQFCKSIDPEVYHSPELYMVWAEKSYFVQRAICEARFAGDWYCWCDIGCMRDSAELEPLQAFPNADVVATLPRDKMTLFAIEPFRPGDSDTAASGIPRLYCRNPSDGAPPPAGLIRLQGGCFVGHCSVWPVWVHLLEDHLQLFEEQSQFAGKDQALMGSVALRCPGSVNIVQAQSAVSGRPVDPWFWFRYYLAGRS